MTNELERWEWEWFTPFSGIKVVCKFNTLQELMEAIHWLSGEGSTCKRHQHNIAVAFDGLALYMSEGAGSCLAEING